MTLTIHATAAAVHFVENLKDEPIEETYIVEAPEGARMVHAGDGAFLVFGQVPFDAEDVFLMAIGNVNGFKIDRD